MPSERPTMPKGDPAARAAFEPLVPMGPGVTLRPMFGHLAAFVNGNMFAGLFGAGLFVRVGDEGAARLLAEGGSAFQPMPGRPMRGYTMLASDWSARPDEARAWIERALEFTAGLPPKKAK